MSWKLLTILALVVAVVSARRIPIWDCIQLGPDISEKCTVHEVRMTPCDRYNDFGCNMDINSGAYMSINFTPNFNATKLKKEVHIRSHTNNVAFTEYLGADACKFTRCPYEVGKRQGLLYYFFIENQWNVGAHEFMFQVYDEEDKTNMCCVLAQINLEYNLKH